MNTRNKSSIFGTKLSTRIMWAETIDVSVTHAMPYSYCSAAFRKAQCEYAESLLFDCSINTVNRCYGIAKRDEKTAQTKGALRER